ncbi:MAG: hypothetical protein RIC04_16430 [Parvibaculum sp.]
MTSKDKVSLEQRQETQTLLRILALGDLDVANGRTRLLKDVVTRLRTKL